LVGNLSFLDGSEERVFRVLLGRQVLIVGEGLVFDRFRCGVFFGNTFNRGLVGFGILFYRTFCLPGFVLVRTPVVCTSTVLFDFLATSRARTTIVGALSITGRQTSTATKLGVAIVVIRLFSVVSRGERGNSV
jgi:hypothetical protein